MAKPKQPRVDVVPFQLVHDPRQIKAFADPLRIRVLNLLSDGPATNQQVAALLGESQAKVLHHVRFLVNVGLVRLVEERVKGGNVEKYYRATARLFGLRPAGPGDRAGLASAAIDAVSQEVAASEAAWPEAGIPWETRRVRLAPGRVDAFYDRLVELVREYWGGPATDGSAETAAAAPDDEQAAAVCFAAVIYRDPRPRT